MRIEIRPDFGNGTTQGTETITFQPAEDTDTITFHANKIDIDSQSLDIRSSDGQNGDSLPIRSHDYLEGQRYRIVVDQKLKKDKTYSLNLRYQGELNNQLQGFYKSHYQSPSGETRIAASTQFSPTDARRAFPCFDEPYFKAKFTIRLARPGNMSTLSNMPLERSEILPTVEGAWYWDNYPETPEMPTYLVAFVMSDLISMQSSDRNIKVWARKEYLSQTNYAANIAPTILRYFEDYFRVYGKLVKKRIEEEYRDMEAEEQAGFRAGRSTVDHLFTLTQIIEKKMARNQEIHLLYIDLKKAYDVYPSLNCGKPSRKRISA
ncbi:endoplasmic reticulum aminopeptidase 1-like [Sitophilus oryzae]|uniref:Endoplasmic reticulum aminopeptidase 1-like n=1 Tax=Sitophilus oryzae TaxID=7048 RepID=A0A6J2Y5G4_SITOR|nr:endoplasmic reticulum aminopeptidase 1-like [Sitophilus oryzae]